MPARCSVFIDAGYLLASAATRVTGTSLRSGIHVEYGKLIDGIREQAEKISGLPVLRVHWYDSARNGVPDYQQQRIGELPRVKLRLGRFGIDGQQKGVDLRLGLDLVTHARNQAADVFLLVSGDDDLTEAVEEAQVHGVEVLVLAAPNADGGAHAVSRHLFRAADELHVIDGALVDASVLKVERPGEVEAEAEAEAGAAPVAVPGTEPTPGPAPAPAPTPTTAPEKAPKPGLAPAPAPGRPAAPVPTPGPGPGPKPSPPATPGAAPAPKPGPAAPAPAPAATTPEPAVPGPRTPKDIAASMRRPEPEVALPDAARTGTWADEFNTAVTTVVGKVLHSLALSATPTTWRALELGRPSIPREVDKALLLDVTGALGGVDLSDLERHELRAAFWTAYDAMVAAARA